jgi:hypothetical protein
LRPSPSKAARTILTASNQVKIASSRLIALISLKLFGDIQGWSYAEFAVQQLGAYEQNRRDRIDLLEDALKSGRKPYSSLVQA